MSLTRNVLLCLCCSLNWRSKNVEAQSIQRKSQNYKTSLTVGAATNDIAGMLRTDTSSVGVHELLSDNVRTNYGHTTIGIGVASAAITADHDTLHANEYRSITQEGAFTAPVVTVESLYAPHYRANDKFGGKLAVR